MKDQTQCVTFDVERIIQANVATLDAPEKQAAAQLGYSLGHRNGYDCGWTHGYEDGVGSAGWKEKARHYLIPAVMAGALLGWVACYFTQVTGHG